MTREEPTWGTPEWHRAHPAFGTDLSKPPAEILAGIRSQLAYLRGQLSDVSNVYPGFDESLSCAEGTLTCCIAYLYHIRNDMLNLKVGEPPTDAKAPGEPR